MKIINEYAVLTEVKKIDSNSILLKFKEEDYVGAPKNVFTLKIFGKDIPKYTELIKEELLNDFTAVEDQEIELIFHRGNIYESPDWGDWMSPFSIPFEKYETEFIDK